MKDWKFLWGVRGVGMGMLLAGWLGCGNAAGAGEPPTEPILRIEAGMHTATIWRIATDAAGHWLVTASEDKTARVWDARTGELLRVLRPPIGKDAITGKLVAVALTPDGQTVACAGMTSGAGDPAASVYLFDRATGRLIRRLSGLPQAIAHLACSRDGQFLAATSVGKFGVRVWRISDGSLVAEDKDYDQGSLGAAFSPDGRLATTCFDGSVRLYDANFRRVAKRQPPGGRQPLSVAWAPDGSKVAVGFSDSTAVNVLSGRDLSFLFAPDSQAVTVGNLSMVAFSADGRTLYAGGLWNRNGVMPIRAWSQGGRGGPLDVPASATTLMDLVARPEGGVFFGAADPAFGHLDASGRATALRRPATAEVRGLRSAFGVSAEGGRVRFEYEPWGRAPAVFSVAERALTPATSAGGLTLPRTIAPGLLVTDYLDHRGPRLNGAFIPLQQFEISRSLAIAPDSQTFALGAEWSVRHLHRAGKELWGTPAPGIAWAVNITANAQLVVAALGDGTLRWYRLRDGQELLACFPHNDRKRWVLWTPEGYYDCSSGGEDLIGWHVNNGKDAAADFFPAARFRETKYRPDVIAKVLDTLDTKEALRLANEESGRKREETELKRRFPPVVAIVAPTDNATFNSAEITVRYTVRTPSDEPVTSVRALVDGRAIEAVRGIRVEGTGATGTEREMRLTLPERDCEVSIIAENRFTSSEPSRVRLKWAGRPATAEEAVFKPRLYVLAVGVSQYAKAELELKFAAKDATDFAATMQTQEGGLYQKVTVRLLTDAAANKDAVLDGLEWLEKQTTGKDVGMLFLAGHGETDASGTYYFLPQNANVDRMKSSCVSFADIQSTLRNLAGKALFFVDTCHSGGMMGRQISGGTRRSGGVDVNRLANELSSAENGVVVFASSTGRQYSLENTTWNNGAFTKALVEGLRGKADVTNRKKISVTSLDFYLAERVKELTDGRQTPVTTKPNTVPDFPIAVVR